MCSVNKAGAGRMEAPLFEVSESGNLERFFFHQRWLYPPAALVSESEFGSGSVSGRGHVCCRRQELCREGRRRLAGFGHGFWEVTRC